MLGFRLQGLGFRDFRVRAYRGFEVWGLGFRLSFGLGPGSLPVHAGGPCPHSVRKLEPFIQNRYLEVQGAQLQQKSSRHVKLN